MASTDLAKIKARLNSLNNKNNKNLFWKPTVGKHEVRIVPYTFQPDNPFIELKFHYGLNNKTYLSPYSFGKPDPIVEWCEKLKRNGSKDDWKLGCKMEPKMRTFCPVIVRGQENEGVKFWGFGKTVYEEILKIMADPDYGDITDLVNGRDIVVEFTEASGPGAFPKTGIRAKPNVKPAVDPTNKLLIEKLENQVDVITLFTQLTYDELKVEMDKWLNPETQLDAPEAATTSSSVLEDTVDTTPTSAPVAEKTDANVMSDFDTLFNGTPK